MAYNYTSPGWSNGGLPAINATNLNAISNLLAAMGSAFDNGGDPANLWGGSGAYSSGNTLASPAGVLPVTFFSYVLGCNMGCASATIPSGIINGQTITIKNYSPQTVTITFSANNLGAYGGNLFILYSTNDYVAFQWDSSNSLWFVVSTNGPVFKVNQTTGFYTETVNSFVSMASAGFTVAGVPAGIWDMEMYCSVYQTVISQYAGIGIAKGLSPISNISSTWLAGDSLTSNLYAATKGVLIPATTTINGVIIQSVSSPYPAQVLYDSNYFTGYLILRHLA